MTDIETKLRCVEIAASTVPINYKPRTDRAYSSDSFLKDMSEILKRAICIEDYVTGKTAIESAPGLIDRLRDVLCNDK